MKKHLVIIGHLSFLITAIFFLVFYKERILYVDCGQQLFEMINLKSYKVYIGRYSMIINQTIPLIGILLHLPLKWLMIIFSISFAVVYYLCFLISVYKFKNIAAGMAIALAPLMIRLLFGHSMGETWLGIGYSALFYAALNYKDHLKEKISIKRLPYYLLLIFLVALNYFIHPITMFMVGFALGYTYFKNKAFGKIWPYLLSVIIIGIYSYKFFFTSYGYEENFFNGLRSGPEHFGHLHKSFLFQYFIDEFLSKYVYFTVFFVFATVKYIIERKYLLAFFIVGFIGIYLLIAGLAFFFTTGFMLTESRLLPLIFMSAIPAIEIIKSWKKNYLVTAAISTMLVIGYFQLYNSIKINHTRRIVFYETLLKELNKYPERKFYAFKEKCDQSPANSWGIAVETLLLSSMNGKENGKTFFLFPKGEVLDEHFMNEKCNFLWVGWWIYYNESHFNHEYFDLGCGPYREIENPECNSDQRPLLK